MAVNERKSLLIAEAGFTIQELLVAIIVGSLLFTFAGSVFLFSQKMYIRWHHATNIYRHVNHISQLILLDLEESKHIQTITDSVLTFTRPSGLEVQYRFDGKGVRRNGQILNAGDERLIIQADKFSQITPQSVVVLSVDGMMNNATAGVKNSLVVPMSAREEFLLSVETGK